MYKYLMVALIFLAACQNPEPSPPPPSPTAFEVNYQGPSLGLGGSGEDTTQGCTAESGCLNLPGELLDLPTEARPLVQQTLGPVQIGIPEGYSPLVLSDEVLVTALSPETPGGFVFSWRQVDEAGLARQQARFKRIDWEAEAGPTIAIPDGLVAIQRGPGGAILWVESFATPGYWPAFQATALAMLEGLIWNP